MLHYRHHSTLFELTLSADREQSSLSHWMVIARFMFSVWSLSASCTQNIALTNRLRWFWYCAIPVRTSPYCLRDCLLSCHVQFLHCHHFVRQYCHIRHWRGEDPDSKAPQALFNGAPFNQEVTESTLTTKP